jgi:uncharacterized protein YoxC
MEFDQEPAPVRRKPRARSRKTAPPQETRPPEPVSEEVENFTQDLEILDLPEEVVAPREPGVFARLDIAPLVIAVAFVLFLFSQVLALRQNAAAMASRAQNLDRQAEILKGVRGNAAALLQQRQGLVNETQRLSTRYNELFMELLKLAETDKDARAVVEKFNIKNNAPAQAVSAAKK